MLGREAAAVLPILPDQHGGKAPVCSV